MSLCLTDKKSTLVQVMAWRRIYWRHRGLIGNRVTLVEIMVCKGLGHYNSQPMLNNNLNVCKTMYSVLRYTFHDFQTRTTTTEGLGF